MNKFDYNSFKNLILKQRLSLDQVCEIMHNTKENVLAIINEAYDEAARKEILDLFDRKEIDSTMKLSSLPDNIKSEILFVALTFRLSKENLISLFKTNIDDVNKLYYDAGVEYIESLEFLNYDSENSPRDLQNKRLQAAKDYWHKRNQYIKEINSAKKINDQEALAIALQNLKELRTDIDDTIALATIDKTVQSLSTLEKTKMVQYRVKYALSITKVKKILNRDNKTLVNIEDEVIKDNPSLALSLEFLRNQWHYVKEQINRKGPRRKDESYGPKL